jgi:hypothetical protein
MPEPTGWLVNWRCTWCGGPQPWWRALLRLRYCAPCALRTNEAGIYLQCGGPPGPFMANAEPHHSPGASLEPDQRPPRLSWWRRMFCQHCYHLDTDEGAWCCECADRVHGLPKSPCIPCGAAGRDWMDI